jgi:hypothetical protein
MAGPSFCGLPELPRAGYSATRDPTASAAGWAPGPAERASLEAAGASLKRARDLAQAQRQLLDQNNVPAAIWHK